MTEQQKASHTPEPWFASGGRVTAKSGNPLDDEPLSIADCDMDVRIDYDTTACANAAFIVRACNAHDQLLAACKAALVELYRVSPSQASPIVRAAIAKAQGR